LSEGELIFGVTVQGAVFANITISEGWSQNPAEVVRQGGLVPSYAIIVRELFPPGEAGTRTAVVLMATPFGMALGGWLSGAIFDLTGSYRAAFVNGIAWNLLNMAIAFWLLRRARRQVLVPALLRKARRPEPVALPAAVDVAISPRVPDPITRRVVRRQAKDDCGRRLVR
jgi:MFS family permease